ncbi:MAG: hypothetical protein ABI238_06675 [Terrimesophilobacter sp.]
MNIDDVVLNVDPTSLRAFDIVLALTMFFVALATVWSRWSLRNVKAAVSA